VAPPTKALSPQHADWMKKNPLRQWRRRNGMSMLALAPMLRVSMLAVQLWENGTNRPNADNMEKLKRALNDENLPSTWDAWFRERPRLDTPDQNFELFEDDS